MRGVRMEIIKVAILELGADDNQTMPIYMGTDIEGKFENEHAENVYKKITNKNADGVELYLLPKTKGGLKWCLDNGVHIVSMSALDWDVVGGDEIKQKYIEKYEKPLLKQAFCICGAGNDGDNGESSASQRGWFAVGAVDKNFMPRSYSSWGLSEVDCVAVDGLDGDFGTSYSAPVITDGAIDFAIMHRRFTGFVPNNPYHYKEHVLDNCFDVWEPGWDKRTGAGVYRRPTRWIFKLVDFTVDELEYKVRRIVAYNNGNMTSDKPVTVVGDVKPKIENGRITLSATNLSNVFGFSKAWDQSTQKATYSGR